MFLQVNKMNSMNLSIIFAQNLISQKDSYPFDTSNYESIYKVFAFCSRFIHGSLEKTKEKKQKQKMKFEQIKLKFFQEILLLLFFQ